MDKIYTFLLDIGVLAGTNGFYYLHDAIKLIIDNKSQRRLKTCELYNNIGKVRNVTSSSVERCIRHSIKTCFNNNKSDKIKNIFGEYNAVKGKITNSDFITICSLHLK